MRESPPRLRDLDTLTPERWQQIETLFHAVLERPASGRAEFLRKSCAGDDPLLAELQNLLFAFENEKQFKPPVGESASTGRLGEIVGGYKLDAELGHGGMGTVYLARRVDGEFEQHVALKVVSAHLRTSFFTERFRAERQILANLNHPNITRLLDGGVSGAGDPYLVMEYVDGEPVSRYCDQHRLDVPRRIRLFLEVCSAVEYAHRNLVVHRDLKPANLLMTKDGAPKLLDFGTAKLLLTTAADQTTTRFNALTPRYASPEQLRGEPVSTSMDIYSLGVILHELVVGAWPFGDPESLISGLERAVREIDPAPPKSLLTDEAARLRSTSKVKLGRQLEGDLRNILAKAIQPDPRQRYVSVEQFAGDLERYLAGEPVLAHGRGVTYRVRKFAKRNWIAVSFAAVFILGLSTATAIATHQARVARSQAAKAETITGFLEDVIYAGDPENVKDRTVLQAMEIARGRLNEVRNDPEIELRIRVARGEVYLGNSLLPQAQQELQRAEVLARRTGDHEMLAATMLLLANVDGARVRPAYMEALALAQKKDGELSPKLRVWILSEVGQYLGFQGNHSPEVEQMLRQAVQLCRTNPMPRETFVTALARLGQYLCYERRWNEAEPLLNEALAASPTPAFSVHLVLDQLGVIRISRGDLEGGERFFRQRRELLMNLAGPGNGKTMDARARWAGLEARLGKIQEAIQEMTDNMVYIRRVYASRPLALWFPTSTFAYILNMADQPARALALATESQACLGPTNRVDPRLAQIEGEIGIALAKLRRYREALPYLEDSERIYKADKGYVSTAYRPLRLHQYLEGARAALLRL
jgi:serine/threonine protein kinase/tetratricopeptide (TPR) repeat protein